MSDGNSYAIRPYDTRVRIVEPTGGIQPNSRIMYFLPVEPQGDLFFGDPLQEVVNINAVVDYDFVYAYPEFPNVPFGPWYIKEESKSLIELLMAYISGLYPQITLDPIGVGFSKSGWGLFSMMLDDQTLFARAIVADAPLDMVTPLFGSDYIFRGEISQYELISRAPSAPWTDPDLIQMAMYRDFEPRMKAMDTVLNNNAIPHTFDDAFTEVHLWSGTWFNRIFTTYTLGLQ